MPTPLQVEPTPLQIDPAPLQIATVRTTAALEALVPEWTQLWHRAPLATPFGHPAWLVPWWRHFAQPDLRVITLRHPRHGALLGLIPLYLYRDPISGQRQLLLVGAGTSDYLDAVVSPECPAGDLAAALETVLAADLGDATAHATWDVAFLTQLPPESYLVRAIEQLRSVSVERFPGEPTSRCPALPISALPPKVRKDVLFCRNAAIAHGKLDLVAATTETIPSAFDHLVETHTARWHEKGEAGVLADPAVLAWHREALPLLHAAGLLRLMTLRLGADPLATMYSLIDPPSRPERTQYLYLMGFDLTRDALQPGRLLTAYTVEHAAKEGVHAIDMLRGDEPYKRFWHVAPTPTVSFALRRP